MSDVKCVVCGEPYEAWSANHGDMYAWEYDLFRKGSGCPSCQGVSFSKWEPETLEDVEFGDEDPMERIIAYEDHLEGKAPKWEAPQPEVLKTCMGCGVQLVRDLASEFYDGSHREPIYDWVVPYKSRAYQWYNSHDFRYQDAKEALENHNWNPWNDENRLACPYCYQTCNECGDAPIATVSELDPGDPYVPGASFLLEGDYLLCDAMCINCYEEKQIERDLEEEEQKRYCECEEEEEEEIEKMFEEEK